LLGPCARAHRGDRDDRADSIRHRLVALRGGARLLAHPVRRRARRPVLQRVRPAAPGQALPARVAADDLRRNAAVLLLFARQLVNWLIQVQILLQFVWQCAAVILLRRYRPDIAKPFRMWLYPLPALVSLAMWLYIFFSAPLSGMIF